MCAETPKTTAHAGEARKLEWSFGARLLFPRIRNDVVVLWRRGCSNFLAPTAFLRSSPSGNLKLEDHSEVKSRGPQPDPLTILLSRNAPDLWCHLNPRALMSLLREDIIQLQSPKHDEDLAHLGFHLLVPLAADARANTIAPK